MKLDDDGREVTSLIGEVIGPRRRELTRRALLFGLPAVSISTAVVAGVLTTNADNARRRRNQKPSVHAGPATTRTPGTLAGPSAAPLWSARLANKEMAQRITVTAGTVIARAEDGTAFGFDAQTGAAKWKSHVVFDGYSQSPLPTLDDIVFTYEATGRLLAVGASDGALRWQTQLPGTMYLDSASMVSGPLVFLTGAVGDPSTGKSAGWIWAVDTTTRSLAWTVTDLPNDLQALALSESAGVILAADVRQPQLVAYSLKDRSELWRKPSGAVGTSDVSYAPENCVAVAGNSVFWAAQQLYALDATTGNLRWTGQASGPSDVFQAVVALPGQAPGGADLVVAAALGEDSGALHGFAADTGSRLWTERGSRWFGRNTVLTAANGVVYAAQRDNGSVFAIDAKTGETRWTFHDPTISDSLTWSLAADGGRLYVAYGASLLAFEG